MPKQIAWTVSGQVSGGPQVSTSGNETVDACDKISVVVPANSADKVVPIPGQAVRLLAIVADRNNALTYKAKYKVKGKDTSAPPPPPPPPEVEVEVETAAIPIDGPQVFFGAGGAQHLLRSLSLQELKITNTQNIDVTVQVLVGRNF